MLSGMTEEESGAGGSKAGSLGVGAVQHLDCPALCGKNTDIRGKIIWDLICTRTRAGKTRNGNEVDGFLGVNILVMILQHRFAKCPQRGNWVKAIAFLTTVTQL